MPLCLGGTAEQFQARFSSSAFAEISYKKKTLGLPATVVIDDYLAHEVSRAKVAGPFCSPHFPNLHVSGFGIIPKAGQPGKWHLIVDLSSPGGASVNDGIDPHKFSLHYITVDQVICMVSRLSGGALMAKFDMEAAYRNILVHPAE